MSMLRGSLGIVTPKQAEIRGPFTLESGAVLPGVTIAYETYGKLNREKTNAILICHALSGDAHVAGVHEGDDKPGWWDAVVGPGKAFDTDRYYVICSNVLGGCKGSTGPSSINPATNKALWCCFSRYYPPRHGQCPETSSRPSRHYRTLRSRRRVDGRHAGAPVDGRISRT